jgi:hypothetical protein
MSSNCCDDHPRFLGKPAEMVIPCERPDVARLSETINARNAAYRPNRLTPESLFNVIDPKLFLRARALQRVSFVMTYLGTSKY